MYSLQTSVQIGQALFKITQNGDFRMVLDCFKVLNDRDLSPIEQVYACLMIFYEDINSLEDIGQYMNIIEQLQVEMLKFFNGGEEEDTTKSANYKLIDWEKDSNLICSAVNNVAKTEVRALEYLHWWTFLGYYMAIGECSFSTIVGIRSKIAKGKKLEDYEKRFKAENPEYFNIDMRSIEQQEADDYFREMWGEG